jgi:hypothetical protein
MNMLAISIEKHLVNLLFFLGFCFLFWFLILVL